MLRPNLNIYNCVKHMLSINKIFNFSIFYKPIKSKVLIYDAYSTRFAKKLFKKTKFSIFHTRYDAVSLYILFLTIFKSGLKDFFKNYKNIKVIYTGKNTLTGGRLKKLKNYVTDTFFLTYGDGISNINIKSLYKFHAKHQKIATITAVHPISRFGEISLSSNNTVLKFNEKPQVKNDWINGGFFIFNKNIFKYLRKDEEILEKYPLQKLANIRELKAYKHKNFWHCIDTIRDIEIVSNLIKIGKN